MRLYYTGASKLYGWQTDIMKSLGNYPSDCALPNDTIANLFSEISEYGARQGLIETKAIVLKNTLQTPVSAVKLYQTYPNNCLVKLEWGVEQLNSQNKLSSIVNVRQTPMGVTFKEPTNVDKLAICNSLDVNGMIGLWVRRTIISPPAIDSISDEDLENYLSALLKKETIGITIDWT